MTNEEAVKMLRMIKRTVYLGNRKFEDAIEYAIKALSEPFQPWEVLVAQAVLPQPKMGRWILDRSGAYCCSECMEPCAGYVMMKPRDKFCKMCGSRNEVTE